MKIYTYPHPILRRSAGPVKNIDEDLQQLIDRMIETMYETSAIGLAANQVGALSRVIVFDVAYKDKGRNPSVLINPEIILSEGKIASEESCLSVIDFCTEVNRNGQIKVRGVDRNGNPLDIEGEDTLAICLQHEIDHLDGRLIIDYISGLKRTIYRKRLKKMLKKDTGSTNS